MGLNIDTFSNVEGGFSFFKAVGHPLAVEPARELAARLEAAGPVAVYDPLGLADAFAELVDISGLEIAGAYAQDLDDLDRTALGRPVQPVTAIGESDAAAVLVVAFDAARLIDHIRHLAPSGAAIESLDALRLPDDMLSNRGRYLDPLNFATNFAFFRDTDESDDDAAGTGGGGGHHTRLVTANYWAGYGAGEVAVWFRLFGADGAALAEWRQALPPGPAGLTVDSRAVRARFGLGPFCGQLFVHVIGAAGHAVVKYALDTYGDDATVLSCTHDANAWPAELYAGLPCPRDGERVLLWVQNSHARAIPPGAVGLNLMGRDEIAWLDAGIPAFGSRALDVGALLPGAQWPRQVEIRAGKHFVRPRYEVIAADGRRRIAHANVERTDLAPDPRIAELSNLMGKGYLLPAPVLPLGRWRSWALPTPMATGQADLPVTLLVHDAAGREVARHRFGRLARADSMAVEIDEVLAAAGASLNGDGGGPGDGPWDDYGHMELVYDFAEGGGADGWLHGLFRYQDRASGHAAETSFGAHIFNSVLTYRGEPQSYAGPAPGLSTRLFLRLGPAPLETVCHLIYPASTPWHGASETDLVLHDGAGQEVARRRVEIPCSGSLFWRYGEMFDADARAAAGNGPSGNGGDPGGDPGGNGGDPGGGPENGYVIVRDTTCRLFGYHGLMNDAGGFSFDHMFGF